AGHRRVGRHRVAPGRPPAPAGPAPRGQGAHSMSDHPTEPRRPRLPPVAYPVLGLVLGGILVFSFSRVLLAVSKDAAPVIALLLAVNILIGPAHVAAGSGLLSRPACSPLRVLAAQPTVGVGLLALNLMKRPV